VVEGGFAPGDPVTHWNLKDRLAALGSNRIGPDLRWSRLAPRSCWPGLPSEFETNFANALGVAQYVAGAFGARAMSLVGTFETCRQRQAMSEFEVPSGKHVLVLSSSQFDPIQTFIVARPT
jgi:hypothetical protein